VVVVSGARSSRVSIAGLLCYRPGHRPRLIYRMLRHRGRAGEPKGFAAQHLCALLAAAHAQLGAPIVLVWDNLPAHHARLTQKFITAHADWLTVYPLPSYAPELNPAEGVWAHLKTGVLVNLAAHGLDHLVAVIKTALKRIQYRARLIEGFLAGAELSLEPL
jgi:transposase